MKELILLFYLFGKRDFNVRLLINFGEIEKEEGVYVSLEQVFGSNTA